MLHIILNTVKQGNIKAFIGDLDEFIGDHRKLNKIGDRCIKFALQFTPYLKLLRGSYLTSFQRNSHEIFTFQKSKKASSTNRSIIFIVPAREISNQYVYY